ncbi:MAG: hypothetical protein MUE63_00270 [Xanthomonadales bacterium]|jgi:hypothetical protein|nr:hypothetical protein [Xanthomonadales bacterium]
MKTGPAFFSRYVGANAFNPSDKASEITLSNGNLTATRANSGNTWSLVRALSPKSSGKWYYEIRIDTTNGSGGGDWSIHGIATSALSSSANVGSNSTSYGYEHSSGNKYNNGTGTACGATLAAGDILGIAVDLDNGKIWFAKNNTWQASGDPAAGTNAAFTGVSGTLFAAESLYKAATTQPIISARFASGSLSYSPPSGFSAWE